MQGKVKQGLLNHHLLPTVGYAQPPLNRSYIFDTYNKPTKLPPPPILGVSGRRKKKATALTQDLTTHPSSSWKVILVSFLYSSLSLSKKKKHSHIDTTTMACRFVTSLLKTKIKGARIRVLLFNLLLSSSLKVSSAYVILLTCLFPIKL